MTKTLLHTMFGLFVTASVLSGCAATTSPSGGTTTEGSMAATINGKGWTSTVLPGGLTGGARATRSDKGVVTVTGVSLDLTEITIVLADAKVGVDSLGSTAGNYAMYSQGIPDTSTAYLSLPSFTNFYAGAVTISAYNVLTKKISGQFHFIGRKTHNLSDTVNVTGGSFLDVEWSD